MGTKHRRNKDLCRWCARTSMACSKKWAAERKKCCNDCTH